jgi:hypothetical protein
VRWIIAHEAASYPEASRKFCVSVNSIRSRIEYRYGSLIMARETAGTDKDPQRVTRRCIICRTEQPMDTRQYICTKCAGQVEQADGEMI